MSDTPAALTPARLDRLADFWWVTVPVAASRLSPRLLGITTDGLYLAGEDLASAAVPPLAILFGLIVGAWHLGFSQEEVYSSSLVVMALMVMVSSFSVAWGFWTCLAYVVGDFLFFPHGGYNTGGSTAFAQIMTRLSLLYPDGLLFALLVEIPLIGRWLRLQTLPRHKSASAFGLLSSALLEAALKGGLVFVWTQSVPMLIRPVYTFHGGYPVSTVMQPLQETGWVLAVLAALLGMARVLLEASLINTAAVRRRAAALRTALPKASPAQPQSQSSWLAIILKATLLTATLAGILEGWGDALIFLGSVVLLLRGRLVFAARFPKWVRFASGIPLVLRLLFASVFSYFTATQIISANWNGDQSFRSILLASFVSLIVIYVLIPDSTGRVPDKGSDGSQAAVRPT